MSSTLEDRKSCPPRKPGSNQEQSQRQAGPKGTEMGFQERPFPIGCIITFYFAEHTLRAADNIMNSMIPVPFGQNDIKAIQFLGAIIKAPPSGK